jgi:hypothetical protein
MPTQKPAGPNEVVRLGSMRLRPPLGLCLCEQPEQRERLLPNPPPVNPSRRTCSLPEPQATAASAITSAEMPQGNRGCSETTPALLARSTCLELCVYVHSACIPYKYSCLNIPNIAHTPLRHQHALLSARANSSAQMARACAWKPPTPPPPPRRIAGSRHWQQRRFIPASWPK